MLNLGCIWDDNSGPEAVLILRDMIARNLPDTTEGQFYCFTDKPDDLGPDIVKLPLNAPRHEVRLFPLHCVIVRGLDCLLRGEQVKTCFYDGSFPEEAALVMFLDKHPKDCGGWVQHVYKIGGGTSVEMSFTPNMGLDRIEANIRSAIQRECAWFEPREANGETALIIGGAPSLEFDLPYIGYLANSCQIFAVNNVPSWLERRGLIPDFHVMLDAHPDCLEFVSPNIPMKRLYASQCDPAVLNAAGTSLICWHGGGEAMSRISGHTFRHVVGGGTTGASRAMVLAYGLGFRKFHLFGLDSSFEDRVHAYDQGQYEKTVNVTCGDDTFKTSPQLLGQAEDFRVMFPDLVAAGCEINVHGNGLLKSLATQMAS